ncbi:hypothetical protein AB0B94_10665 [Micromonospora sp. NPDC048986]|uniref:hypothetical protein n=1 Tax=Micromonospora sp. NPDC048986 TaxID=3155644 RepID=UPI0033D95AA5
MAAVGYGADREPESEPAQSGESAQSGEPAPRRLSAGARLLVAAAAVVLLLGAAAVTVIVAAPDHLGMTYSSQPDGTRPDGTRPDGTRPMALPPGTAAARGASLTRTRLRVAAVVRVPLPSTC